jgi:RNA 3'-terminal phosphate cyclase (ATP)
MAAFTLIVPALFATGPSSFAITGGLFQDFAPSFFHMKEVLAPLLRKMGADVVLRMVKPGYVPEGRGELTMDVNPVDCLKPMRSTAQGTITKIHGIAISSHLKEQRVSHRMASRCKEALRRKGYSAEIDIMEDASAVQKGAALAIWAETDTGCILGADRAGRPGRSSESIADFVARSFVGDIESNACTDRHLADQLILFAAVAKGTTQFTVPAISEHVEANLWLVEKILGVQARVDANVITIEGAGLSRRQPDALG